MRATTDASSAGGRRHSPCSISSRSEGPRHAHRATRAPGRRSLIGGGLRAPQRSIPITRLAEVFHRAAEVPSLLRKCRGKRRVPLNAAVEFGFLDLSCRHEHVNDLTVAQTAEAEESRVLHATREAAPPPARSRLPALRALSVLVVRVAGDEAGIAGFLGGAGQPVDEILKAGVGSRMTDPLNSRTAMMAADARARSRSASPTAGILSIETKDPYALSKKLSTARCAASVGRDSVIAEGGTRAS